MQQYTILSDREGNGIQPEKNEQPAASPDLRSDLNLHKTHNGHPRAVEDTMMSQMAPFPQDHQQILMENSVLTPSFSSLNTPTPGVKWPNDLRLVRTTCVYSRRDKHDKRRYGLYPRT